MIEHEQLIYELFVLRAMINELPDNISTLIANQLNKFVCLSVTYQQEVINNVIANIQDTSLIIKSQEFDLHVTRKERDELRNKS